MSSKLSLLCWLGLAMLAASEGCGSGGGGDTTGASSRDGGLDALADIGVVEVAPPDASGLDVATDADATDSEMPDAGPRCGDRPTTLVDTTTFYAPDAGPVALSAPGVFVGESDVFYTSNIVDLDSQIATGFLWSIPVRGGAPVKVATAPGIVLYALTPTVAIYGANRSAADAHNIGPEAPVFTVPLSGGAPTRLFITSRAYGFLTSDADSVYFTSEAGTQAVPIAGGAPRTLTSMVATTAAVVGTNLVFTDATGDVLEVPLAGGTPSTLVPSGGTPASVFACGASVCWTTLPKGGFFAEGGVIDGGALFDLEGSTAKMLVRAGGGSPVAFLAAIAFDGERFYWTAGDGAGALYTLPVAGGTPTAVATMLGAGDVAVDDECVYWSNTAGVYSLSKSSPGPFPFRQ